MPIGTFLPFSTLFENAVLKRNVNHLFGILESPRFLNSDDFLDFFFLLFQKLAFSGSRVSNNSELKGAPNLVKKHTKRCTIFCPKKRHIFGKRRTIFDPSNNFYCIFMHKFFWRCQILLILFSNFLVFL